MPIVYLHLEFISLAVWNNFCILKVAMLVWLPNCLKLEMQPMPMNWEAFKKKLMTDI